MAVAALEGSSPISVDSVFFVVLWERRLRGERDEVGGSQQRTQKTKARIAK
jgi:hypothetical protein